jgi:XTP/dITP diphosphohydrolase
MARRFAARATSFPFSPSSSYLLSLADDSGLSVDALHGQPGVYSKRFFPGTDHDRNQKLLELLTNNTQREATFTTVLCLFDRQKHSSKFFTGEVHGSIARAEVGENGFGYDSIFIPNGFNQTFAQMRPEQKNQLSHRGRAFAILAEYLKNAKEIHKGEKYD